MNQKDVVERMFDLQKSNFIVRDVKVFKDKIVVEIEPDPNKDRTCSKCRSLVKRVHDYREIKLKDIPGS